MARRSLMFAFMGLIALAAGSLSQDKIRSPGDQWRIKGALSEACTCNVPCSCNFGQGPSPHKYCFAVYSYYIKEGSFNGIKLDGLKFGGVTGRKGGILYVDFAANGEQREALDVIAKSVQRVTENKMRGRKLLGIRYVPIRQEYDDKKVMLDIGGVAGFKANYIMGMDRSKPVVVINNTSWAIHESIKAKTEYIRNRDTLGNTFAAKNTNSNQGDFEYSDQTDFAHPFSKQTESNDCCPGASCPTNPQKPSRSH